MQITSGVIKSAQKVLVYGPEGIGKSTIAAAFPDPLFIDTEGSTKHMDVRRLDAPSSWTMLMQEVMYVRANPNVCDTLVIDTVDWAESLCISHVCAKAGKEGIEDFGYGKGFTYLAEEFGNLLNLLTEVIERGVNVVLLAHATLRKFEQPDEQAAYDRWELKLQKKTAPLVKEWCDSVLFANYKTIVVKSEGKTAKPQGGKRVMYTTHHPAWDAKNRWGLPDEVPFEFAAIAANIPVRKSSEISVPELSLKPEPVPAPVEDDVPLVAPADAPTLPATEIPPHLTKLYQLMAANGVEEHEIRAVVAAKGYFPKDADIEVYPVDFVEGVLVGAWPNVFEAIKAAR